MNDDRLESWKEIAAYLDRGVRTVQRWEKREGLPVYRHTHEKLGTVYAFKPEIDAWWESRRAELAATAPSATAARLRSIVARRRAGWVAAGSLSALLVAGVVLFGPTRPEVEVPVLLTPLPVTTLPGSEYFPSFSPDGNHVAFTWSGPRQPLDVYVKAIGSETLQQVTDHPAVDLGPAWSPDGRWIAFLRGDRIRDPTREVLVVPSRGGPERKLGETQPDWGPFLAWTPDARGVVYSCCRSPEPCVLKLVWLDTLEEQQLTSPPAGPGGDTAPAVSADGRLMLFVRRKGGHTAQVLLQRVDSEWRPTGDPEPITPDDVFATAPAWASDGQSFFYMSGEVGVSMKLWQMAPSRGATPRLLATLGDTFFEPGITVHEDRLITMSVRVDSNIRQARLTAGEIVESGVPLTKSNRMDTFPHFSPDGRKIAFDSTRYGGSDIFVMDEDGSNVVQLTSLGRERARAPRWSPDGSQIVFAAGGEKGDIYLVKAAGGTPRLLAGGPADDLLPSWSADGHSIYFTSDRSGRSEIWKVSTKGGEPVQLTSDAGYRPIACPDGEFVYYTKRKLGAPHGAPLWRVRVDGSREEQVFETPVFHPENFDVVEGRIYYSTASSTRRTKGIRVFDLETRTDREIAHMGPAPTTGLSVSRDGTTILFSHVDYQSADLVMFEGL